MVKMVNFVLCIFYHNWKKKDKYFNFSLLPRDPKISHLARLDGHAPLSLRKAVWYKLAEDYRVHE